MRGWTRSRGNQAGREGGRRLLFPGGLDGRKVRLTAGRKAPPSTPPPHDSPLDGPLRPRVVVVAVAVVALPLSPPPPPPFGGKEGIGDHDHHDPNLNFLGI